jgi:hypothetical protein
LPAVSHKYESWFLRLRENYRLTVSDKVLRNITGLTREKITEGYYKKLHNDKKG